MTGPRALAGIALAAAAALTAGTASAQVPYQIGDRRGGVTVDTSVLESLGPLPTVPEMLRPGTPVGEIGYDARARSLAAIAPPSGSPSHVGRAGTAAPALGVDSAPAPDWLRRPDAPRYAPLPDSLPGRAAPPAAGMTAPTLKPPAPARAAAPEPRAPEPTRTTETRSAPTRPSVPAPSAVSAPNPPVPPAAAAPSTTAAATPSRAPAPSTSAAPAPKAPPPPTLPPAAAAAPPPPPPPAPVPAREEPSRQVAAATPGPTPTAPAAPAPSAQGTAGDELRVPFDGGQSTLPDAAKAGLDALATRLRRDEGLRVQLLAYADGTEDDANRARRLSLSRALAVRAYLIDKQIQSTRMDVRALGNRSTEAPRDRVDVVLVNR